MNKYSYVDLFAGAGGLSLGFGNAGFKLKMANDIDKDALLSFKENFDKIHPGQSADIIIRGDITQLYEGLGTKKVKHKGLGHKTVKTAREQMLKLGVPDVRADENVTKILEGLRDIDVLVGGPPCQGFSMIGRSKRSTVEERLKGFIDDSRNQLFRYYLKFAEKLNPKIVLIENVAALNSAMGYRDLIEKALMKTGVGYDVFSLILDASDFGVPQHRRRIFFIGVRKDLVKQGRLSSAEAIFDDVLNSKRKQRYLWDAIGDLPQIHANPKRNNYSSSAEVSYSSKGCFGMDASLQSYDELVKETLFNSEINNYRGVVLKPEKLYNHKTRYNNANDLYIYRNLHPGKYLNDPLNAKALTKVTYGINVDSKGVRKVKSFSDKYFKLDPNKVSKTIIAHLEKDGNSYVHPGPNARSLTPREAARIQTFPDWYKFKGSVRNQFRQVGNAVPPLLAKVIAKSIYKALDNQG